jgi:hypothetical protein
MIKLGSGSVEVDDPQPTFALNPYLIALGILLLELSEKKSFVEWINSGHGSNRMDSIVERATIASLWLKEALGRRKMSDTYAAVVQLCLFSSFTPVQLSTSLEDEEFRNAVYRHILRPLEEEYEVVKEELEIPAP